MIFFFCKNVHLAEMHYKKNYKYIQEFDSEHPLHVFQ